MLPIIVMPLFLFASSMMEKRRQERMRERTFHVATGGETTPAATRAIETAVERRAGKLQFALTPVEDWRGALERGEIDAFVEVVTGERARETAVAEAKAQGRAAPESVPQPDFAFAVNFRSDSSTSQTASRGLVDALREARARARAELLASRGFATPVDRIAAAAAVDVASASQAAGLRVARFLTVLLVFLMMMGGATVASDIVAGEKERGTLETLLTTAARRSDIVAAKLLVILTVAVVIIVLEFSSVAVYARLHIVEVPGDYAAILHPATLAALVVLYLPVGALVASVLLLVSGLAKSYKEAQLYFFPVMLLGAVPAAAAVLPDISLRSIIALVPLAGISVAVKEVLVGRYDWPMLAVAWLATMAAAALITRRAAVMLSSEALVTSADRDAADLTGGPALFPKRVTRWFALMWVAIFTISAAASSLDVRLQVLVNVVGIFLGGSLLMLRTYRLDPRRALSLRMPHPMVWLAVLVGAPSGLVVGLGVARLASYVLPVPTELIEQFGQSLFPADVPVWQMLLFIAVIPGICEEIAFRGMLLHGLRRRFRPVALCLVVGAVFGLFHFALFRLASTAFLGVVLAAVTVLTGSIFPAMLWHAMNNGIAIVATMGIQLDYVEAWWHPLVALVPFALSLWIMWRWRRYDVD